MIEGCDGAISSARLRAASVRTGPRPRDRCPARTRVPAQKPDQARARRPRRFRIPWAARSAAADRTHARAPTRRHLPARKPASGARRLGFERRRRLGRFLDVQRLRLGKRGIRVRRIAVHRQPARADARPRLHPFARAGEDRLGVGRRECPLLGSRRGLALQRADRPFEGKTQSAQNLRRGALAVADDRRQHDGAIDFAPPATAGGRRCGLENAAHVGGDNKVGVGHLRARRQHGELCADLAHELGDVDIARCHHKCGVGVVAQRQQHMLEGHLGVAARTRVVGRPRQRSREAGRHVDTAQAAVNHERASPGWRAAAQAPVWRRARLGWIAHFGRLCSGGMWGNSVATGRFGAAASGAMS